MAVKKEPVAPAPVVSDKKKALETAMQQIEKMYGKGSIMRYGAESTLNVESIPTGSLSLDLALGIGGLPRGRIVEIYGPESSGKTTLALHVLAEAQKMGGEVAFVDAEHALDPTYAKALGVNVLERIVQFDLLGDGNTIVGDEGCAELLIQHHVAALGAQGDLYGIRQLVDAGFQRLAGLVAALDDLCHI